MDIHAEELGNNVKGGVGLHGDLKSVVTQVTIGTRQSSMTADPSCLTAQLTSAEEGGGSIAAFHVQFQNLKSTSLTQEG